MGKSLRVLLAPALILGILASALPAVSQEVPIGKPRTDREFAADVEQLLYDRRISHSDLLPGGLKDAFKVKGCTKCHENAAGVEGQIFYGPNFKDFAKDQKTQNRAVPEKRIAPGRDYDFVKTHGKRQKLWVGEVHEQLLKQNQ
jgi:hypothetical protein